MRMAASPPRLPLPIVALTIPSIEINGGCPPNPKNTCILPQILQCRTRVAFHVVFRTPILPLFYRCLNVIELFVTLRAALSIAILARVYRGCSTSTILVALLVALPIAILSRIYRACSTVALHFDPLHGNPRRPTLKSEI